MNDILVLCCTIAGAALTAVAAIVLASKERTETRVALTAFAVVGVVAGGLGAYAQYAAARDADKKRESAESAAKVARAELHSTKEELDEANKVLDAASINVEALAQLNKLSSGKFYVVLSADTNACLPCGSRRRIDKQFTGAAKNQGIRVIDTGRSGNRYRLIFGKMLSLAAAGVYQRLAIDHALANGRPLIESETGSETVIDCDKSCPARK